MDELTTLGPSTVLALHEGLVTEFTIDPVEHGLAPATADDLRGGTPEENALVVRRVLAGEAGPHRDIVVLNAAGGLVVAGLAADLDDGLALAAAAIDDGRAQAHLDGLIRVSNARAGD